MVRFSRDPQYLHTHQTLGTASDVALCQHSSAAELARRLVVQQQAGAGRVGAWRQRSQVCPTKQVGGWKVQCIMMAFISANIEVAGRTGTCIGRG